MKWILSDEENQYRRDYYQQYQQKFNHSPNLIERLSRDLKTEEARILDCGVTNQYIKTRFRFLANRSKMQHQDFKIYLTVTDGATFRQNNRWISQRAQSLIDGTSLQIKHKYHKINKFFRRQLNESGFGTCILMLLIWLCLYLVLISALPLWLPLFKLFTFIKKRRTNTYRLFKIYQKYHLEIRNQLPGIQQYSNLIK